MTWRSSIGLLETAERAVGEHGAMQKPTELAALLAVVRALDPDVVYEIGTATGGTLWAVASILGPGRTYVSLDLPGGLHGPGELPEAGVLGDLIGEAAWPCHVEVIRGDSRTVELPDDLEPPNVVLLDGDHTYGGAYADWDRFAPLVVPGGAVAFHDILEHSPAAVAAGVEVAALWEELVESEPRTAELVDRRPRPGDGRWGGQWGGWGVVFR